MTNEINNLAKQVDLLEFIRQDKSGTLVRASQVKGKEAFFLNPCPICGKEGHFAI